MPLNWPGGRTSRSRSSPRAWGLRVVSAILVGAGRPGGGQARGSDQPGTQGARGAAPGQAAAGGRERDPAPGRGVLRPGERPPKMIYPVVEELAADRIPVAVSCRVLGVSRAGYHEWRRRGPSARSVADEALTATIRDIHRMSRGTCGAPRVHAELRLAAGVRCGRKRVARLRRADRLEGVCRRRRKGCTVRVPAATPCSGSGQSAIRRRPVACQILHQGGELLFRRGRVRPPGGTG